MGHIEKTVFISYRRTNFYTALAVYQDLTAHGYDVFFDYQSIDSGIFSKAILENIEARAHFVLVLSSSALERCSQPNDWLRLEIETAMELNRNIVPLMMEGFDFGSPATIQALSGKLATLNTYNGLRLYSDYFFDAMEKLRIRFLNAAIDDLRSREVSTETRETNEIKKSLADEAPQVETQQISAEEWFERGYVFQNDKNLEEAYRCYSEAIRLDPAFANAHLFIGSLLNGLKRYTEAEAAYRKAIELTPNDATTHWFLGNLLGDMKRNDEAEAAYRKAIELYEVSLSGDDPDDATAYSNLGALLNNLKRYDEAEAAYRKAIELDPSNDRRYVGLINLFRFNNNTPQDALPLLAKRIELNPDNYHVHLAIASIDKLLGKEIAKENIDKTRQFMPEDDWYNRACLESVCDNFDLAFEYLEKAAKLEKFNPAWAWEDPDLQWIRDDPHFVQMVGPKPE